ncbi:MAG: type II secretion system protein [Candidatus Omnitrophica bacterium]|nr:type II secretion system protein [Candidatus Omnitrophota bacterium]
MIKNSAFTLLELIVVIVILGILATLGFTQYNKTVERTREAEAIAAIGSMTKLAWSYYLANGTFVGIQNADCGVGSSSDQIPSSCRSANYFWYQVASSDYSAQVDLNAVRCTSGGKTPNYSTAYNPYIRLLNNGTQQFKCQGGCPEGNH